MNFRSLPPFVFALLLLALSIPVTADEPANLIVPPVAAQIRQSGSGNSPGTPAVRDEVDRHDNIERVVVLAPGGPVVVELAIDVDGKSFRIAREALIDEMLAMADADEDGEPTWEEAFANPRFGFGRLSYQLRTPQQRTAGLKLYDGNGNGLVDRHEARAIAARFGNGGAFRIQPNYAGLTQPDIKSVLDTDGDGAISPDELKDAGDRLKSRDGNDNDLLEAAEVGGGQRQQIRYRVTNGRRVANVRQAVWSLGPAADLVAVFEALKTVYAGEDGRIRAEQFAHTPGLFEQLDLDANGTLDSGEVIKLHLIQPHVRLHVALGAGEGAEEGIRLRGTPAGLQVAAESDKPQDELVLTRPGAVIRFAVPDSSNARTTNYTAGAKAALQRYDTDKNGYIEREELRKVARNNQFLIQMFDRWDANGDGKVYADEIEADYQFQQAPLRSQVAVTASEEPPSLFRALDGSGDGRLSLREMRTAAERLKSLDKNSDGRLGVAELPGKVELTITRGGRYYGTRTPGSAGRRMTRGSRTVRERGPEWFVRMDRNGDGDVTLREFLGTAEQFGSLDTNGDGFIEPQEAEAVKSANRSETD